jgi:hypothetical protein
MDRFVPAKSVYLGHSPEDLSAASQAGLLTIAFNCDADAIADLYIEQFDQLFTVVRGTGERLLAAG